MKELPIDMISILEQAEANLVNFAPLLASYYDALIKAGVPDGLAEKLVLDWHNMMVNSASNKGG